MPFTISITEKQRANIGALNSAITDANARFSSYTQAILDSVKELPEWSGLTLTDAGLVLGDVPAAPIPPATSIPSDLPDKVPHENA